MSSKERMRKCRAKKEEKTAARKEYFRIKQKESRLRRKKEAKKETMSNDDLFDDATPPPSPMETPQVLNRSTEAADWSGVKANGEPYTVEELRLLQESNAIMDQNDRNHVNDLKEHKKDLQKIHKGGQDRQRQFQLKVAGGYVQLSCCFLIVASVFYSSTILT